MVPRSYIEDGRLTVGTGEEALTWILALKERSERSQICRIWLVKSDLDIIYRPRIVQKATDVLFCLSTTNGCEEGIDGDISMKYILNHEDEPCKLYPDADAYFELEENEISENCQCP